MECTANRFVVVVAVVMLDDDVVTVIDVGFVVDLAMDDAVDVVEATVVIDLEDFQVRLVDLVESFDDNKL